MCKRRIGHVVLVATTITVGHLVGSISSSSSSSSISTRSSQAATIVRGGRGATSSLSSPLLRDYSDTDDEGPGFFGSFQDEIRKMREEIEMETEASFEQLRNELLVRKTKNIEESQDATNSSGGTVNANESSREETLHESEPTKEQEIMTTPQEIPTVVENTEQVKAFKSVMKKSKKSQQHEQQSALKKKIIHKGRNSMPHSMPQTHMAAVSVSGGGVKSVVHNKKQIHQEMLRLAEETEELVRAKRMLQSELEHSAKVMSRKELYRVIVTGGLLLLLCLLTTLALRVVEASLGVP